jgi:hypothetical protein
MWRNNLQPDLSARCPCQATAPAPPPPRAGGSSPDPPSPLPKPRRHPRSRAPHRRGPGRTTSMPFHTDRSLTFPSTRAPRQTPSRRTPNPSYASLLEHQVIVFGTARAALQLTYSSPTHRAGDPSFPLSIKAVVLGPAGQLGNRHRLDSQALGGIHRTGLVPRWANSHRPDRMGRCKAPSRHLQVGSPLTRGWY